MRKDWYLWVVGAFLSVPGPGTGADASDRGERYVKVLGGDFQVLTTTNNRQEAFAAAERISGTTDATLKKLRANKSEFGEKFVVYETQWATIRPALLMDPQNQDVVAQAVAFSGAFQQAREGRSCSVLISASRGEGASIQYAKAHDAEAGRSFRQLGGTTTMVHEIEPAEYKFRAFRNGQQTGETGVIACTTLKGHVKLVISE